MGPQGLEPHALPGAARPSGCNGREREREVVTKIVPGGLGLSFRAWADLLADTESPAAKGVSCKKLPITYSKNSVLLSRRLD